MKTIFVFVATVALAVCPVAFGFSLGAMSPRPNERPDLGPSPIIEVTPGTYIILKLVENPFDGEALVELAKERGGRTVYTRLVDFDRGPLPGDRFEPLFHDPDTSYRDGVEWLLVEEGPGHLSDEDDETLEKAELEWRGDNLERNLFGDELLLFGKDADVRPEAVCAERPRLIISIDGAAATVPFHPPFRPLLASSVR